MEEISIERLVWQAPEYNHTKRGMDFFWTIGIAALVLAIGALWTGNYLFLIFVLVSGFCLIFFSIREPEHIEFAIDNDGMSFGRDKFPWKRVRGFRIKPGSPYVKLLIETDKHFMPVYTIPLPPELSTKVKESLITIIPEVELEESQSILFMERIGF
jgi:hypothetical protein